MHEGSLRVLRELGLRVDSERARKVFAKAGPGTRIEGDRVTFEREVVEWAIRVSPPAIDVFDRRGRLAFRLGEGQEATRFGTGVTNLWYQDPQTDEIAPFHREHLVSGVRLSQKLGNYDVVSTLGVLRDLPPAVADLYAVLEMVANAEKPLVLLVSDESLFPAVLELLEAVHGDAGHKPFVLPYLNPITPLSINEGTSDKLLDSVARGIPAIYSNYGMAGMTTPITCAGTLAFLNAELLAGLVLSQLAREGAPGDPGQPPHVLRDEARGGLLRPPVVPHQRGLRGDDGPLPDPPRGDLGQRRGLGARPAGHGHAVDEPAHERPGPGGPLPLRGQQPELEGLLAPARRLRRRGHRPGAGVRGGVRVDEAAIGVDEAIAAMRSDGHFLMTPTTLDRYRTASYPGLFPHISLEKWQEDRPVADRVLRERTRDLLAEAEPPEDHDEVLARGEEFLRRRVPE